MNSYKIIDESTWNRSFHAKIFRNSVEPAFCVTFELEIADFLEFVRAQKLSFTMSLIYAAASAANSIENFRYRFLDGKIVLFDKVDTAFTYLDKETELFKFVRVPFEGSLREYAERASKAAINQKAYFTGPLGNDVFAFSSLPWISYTHISHTNSGAKDNATPLFDFGKYFERDGKTFIPFSVQAHHSFVDGLHVGRFAEALQKMVRDLVR